MSAEKTSTLSCGHKNHTAAIPAMIIVATHTFGAASFAIFLHHTITLLRYNRRTMFIVDSILSITSAIITVLTLGLAIGFSPLIYAAFVSTLTHEQPQRKKLQTTLLGGITLGTLVLLASGAAIGMLYYYATNSMVYRVVIAVAGGALIGIAVRRWLNGPPRLGKKKNKSTASPLTFAVIGFTKTIFAASSIAAALVASTVFATIGDRPLMTLATIVAICVCAVAPFVIVASSRQASGRMKSWMTKAQAAMRNARESDSHAVPFALTCCGLVLIAYALSH